MILLILQLVTILRLIKEIVGVIKGLFSVVGFRRRRGMNPSPVTAVFTMAVLLLVLTKEALLVAGRRLLTMLIAPFRMRQKASPSRAARAEHATDLNLVSVRDR